MLGIKRVETDVVSLSWLDGLSVRTWLAGGATLRGNVCNQNKKTLLCRQVELSSFLLISACLINGIT
ncbi:hypothetical protein M6B38_289915 [Iris pallida]|uniref:Uncharacterized protein n=1 Tax=Iris pallida TaxID=29817 RepID=A0AAX6HWB6_IRIPA|nr:hypothetical protein M6B38_289915 [Iris pallida]